MTKRNSGQLSVVSSQSKVVDVREIDIDRLVISPEETRKTIDQAALKELAASIELHGVEPLIVRRIPGVAGLHEIVSGQRRFLASQIAGLTTCPCSVRELSDEEARELRIVSNLQREDLPPMEEAEAYGKLLEDPGATIETVAAKLAKSPSYVGRRVQLLKAIAPVREALRAGAIEAGHALELARLDEARQRQMLTRMQCGATLIEPDYFVDDDGDEGVCRFCGCTKDEPCAGGCSWSNDEQTVCTSPECLERFREETGQETTDWRKTHFSVVELRREISQSSHVDLKNAPFPLIADLAPMPCVDCPKRAGNAQLLFDDCAQDTCTDRGCFDAKVKAWIDAELAATAAEKRKLLKLTGNWSSKKDEIECGDYSGARVLKTPSECQHGKEGIWIDGRNAGKRATVCRTADCKTHHGGSSGRSGGSPKQVASPKVQQERRDFLAKVRAEKAYRAELFTAISKVDARGLGEQPLTTLVTGLAVHAFDKSDSTRYGDLAAAMGVDKDLFGWGGKDKLEKHVASLPMEQQILFARMAIEDSELCVHEHDVPGGGALAKRSKLDLEGLAEIVGVDWKALRKLHGGEPEKPAKPAAKKAVVKPGKTKKKAGLSAAARKRIAAAVKKRWSAAKKKVAPKKRAKA